MRRLTPAAFLHMTTDNMYSMFLCSKAADIGMKQAGGGVIINMAWIAAENSEPEHARYNSAKNYYE